MEIIKKRIKRERARYDDDGAAHPVVDVNWDRIPADSDDSHIISRIDKKPKSSHAYYNCMGVAAVGTETKTGKRISFLTHQSPYTVLDEQYGRSFKTALRRRLKQIQKRSDPDSVSVAHFGGSRGITGKRPEMLKQVRRVTRDAINLAPKVVRTSRSAGENPTHAVLDTKRARLHIFRFY
ncbi:MAG: hypothetical protein AAB573_03865 [Patescibacteria group bacterium]